MALADRDKAIFLIHLIKEKLILCFCSPKRWMLDGLTLRTWFFSLITNKNGYMPNSNDRYYFHQLFIVGVGIAYRQKDKTKKLPTIKWYLKQ